MDSMQLRCSSYEELAAAWGWKPTTVIVMLYGHFDESGELSAETGRLVRATLGGFFSSGARLENFCLEWQAALDAESLGSFHMKELFSDEDNYEHWSPERQHRLDRFVTILCDYAVCFCAHTSAKSTHTDLLLPRYDEVLPAVLLDATELAQRYNSEVHMTFAQTDEISGEWLGKYYDTVNWDSALLSGWGISRAGKVMPLQGAEIVARALKRYYEDGFITHSFQRILETGIQFYGWPQ